MTDVWVRAWDYLMIPVRLMERLEVEQRTALVLTMLVAVVVLLVLATSH